MSVSKATIIPAIIHQTWKTKTGLSDRHAFWRASFQDVNPGFSHPIYDDADNLSLVQEKAPSLLEAYQAFPHEIYRVDMVRALYLFLFGGFYADLDFQCLRPFDKYCVMPRLLFGRMGTFQKDENFEHEFPNALMGSPPFDGFWLFYLSSILRAQAAMAAGGEARVEHVTGPVALRQALLAYTEYPGSARRTVEDFLRLHPIAFPRDRLAAHAPLILPAHVWYPINWADNLHQMFRRTVLDEGYLPSADEARALFPHSDAVTYWQRSWG
jgi:mannosyltransferase OCH1-like enzyme